MVEHICCDLYHNRQAFRAPIQTKRAKHLFWLDQRQLEIYVQFYQHPSYPKVKENLQKICGN